MLENVDSLNEELRPSGDPKLCRPTDEGDPKLSLRPLSLASLDTAFCNNGLGEGEKEVRGEALVLADPGDESLPRGLALRDPESRYFGGVT